MIIKDHQSHLNIDTNQLKIALQNVESWDDWYKIQEKIFKIQNWIYPDIDELELQKNRDIIVVNGIEWIPLANGPKVSDEIVYLYEICNEIVFHKLNETEEYEDDLEEPYGYYCVVCLRKEETVEEKYCPFCGRKLFRYPISNYNDY